MNSTQHKEGKTELSEFLEYVTNTRNLFCDKVAGHMEFNTPFRTICDDVLICFDQMKERLATPPAPEGRTADEIPKLKMVVGFMFNKNETDVLLIEKKKPVWQFGKFNGIGGKVEKDETYGRAMCREFQEETGISWGDWKYVITMSGDDWEVQVFTAKTDEVFDYKQMEDEKVHLIPINELDHYEHVSNLRWLIPMCLDNNDGRGTINYQICNMEEYRTQPDERVRIAGEAEQTPQEVKNYLEGCFVEMNKIYGPVKKVSVYGGSAFAIYEGKECYKVSFQSYNQNTVTLD